jgi:hypothetical protein
MKGIAFALFLLTILPSCTKDRRGSGDACIQVNSTNIDAGDTVQITNCGDELPADRVETSIDWGDGETSMGQTGSHTYSTSGDFTIRLLLNGDYAAEVAEIEDETKVKLIVHVD